MAINKPKLPNKVKKKILNKQENSSKIHWRMRNNGHKPVKTLNKMKKILNKYRKWP